MKVWAIVYLLRVQTQGAKEEFVPLAVILTIKETHVIADAASSFIGLKANSDASVGVSNTRISTRLTRRPRANCLALGGKFRIGLPP